MKKINTLLLSLLIFASVFGITKLSVSQIKLQEGFESQDTVPGSLPAGWAIYNVASFPIYPNGNWMVEHIGQSIRGVAAPGATLVHSGNKAIVVNWYAGVDSNSGSFNVSDAWLITKGVQITAGDSLVFWVAGGSLHPYIDSLQIWGSSIDSTPEFFTLLPTNKLATIHLPYSGQTTPFEYRRFAYSLTRFVGQKTWIGFRYNTDTSIDGYAVLLDDIRIAGPVGITPIGTNVPDKFNLSQNYPNPFNPTTKIKFDIAKSSNVKLTVFNYLGQEVAVLQNGFLNAGFYETSLDAKNLASGTYFYRIEAGDFVQTKKLTVVK